MVQIHRWNSVARIVLDAPEEKNKLSVARQRALAEALNALLQEPPAALALMSSAPDIFAAGADIEELSVLDADTADAFSQEGQALMAQFAAFPAPVFCLVAGPCFGGALDLALACDYVFAADNAVFCHSGVRLGIMTGWGGTLRLPRRVGDAVARHMLVTGAPMAAQAAASVGLVDRLVQTHDQLLGAFEAACRTLAVWPKREA